MATKTKELLLPISRVKTIMKSSPEVENVGQDSLAVVTKATELFLQDLARQALKVGKGVKVDYSDLAEVVQSKHNLFFLREIIPKKITVKHYKAIMKHENLSDGISSESESSEGEEEAEEEEEEDDDEDGEGEEEEGEEEEEDEDGDGDGDDVEVIEDEEGEEDEDDEEEDDNDEEDDDDEEQDEAQR